MSSALPITIAAERAILSTVLNDFNTFERVVAAVKVEDISDASLRCIYSVCKEFYDSDKAWTWPIIADAVSKVVKRPVELLHPVSYIGDIVSLPSDIDTLDAHITVLHERSLRGQLATKITSFQKDIENPAKTSSELHGRVVGLDDLFDKSVVMKMRDVSSSNLMSEIDVEIQRIKNTPFVGTGYPPLDSALTWGFAKGQISLIAARPSMGKSTFRTNIMYNMTQKGIYSITISKEQSIAAEYFRLIAIDSGVPLVDVARVQSWESSGYKERIELSLAKFSDNWNHRIIKPIGPFYVRDIKQVVLGSRKKGFSPAVVFVDLFDQLDDFNSAGQGELANLLYRKLIVCGSMAEEIGIHICLLCQIRRLGKDRDKLDIREMFQGSGGYEQRSDLILIPDRPAYYEPDEYENNQMIIQIAKQRDGVTVKVPLAYNEITLKVSDPREERQNWHEEQNSQSTEHMSRSLGKNE